MLFIKLKKNLFNSLFTGELREAAVAGGARARTVPLREGARYRPEAFRRRERKQPRVRHEEPRPPARRGRRDAHSRVPAPYEARPAPSRRGDFFRRLAAQRTHQTHGERVLRGRRVPEQGRRRGVSS